MVGHIGQAGKNILEVSVRINAAPPAGFDDGVNDGSAFASVGIAHEELILFAERRRANGVLDQVVNIHADIGQNEFERGSLAQGVINSYAQQTLRQISPAGSDLDERPLKPPDDGPALGGAKSGPMLRPDPLFPQAGFGAIQVLDLPQDPAGHAGRLFEGFVELPPNMRPAPGHFNAVASLGKNAVGGLAIALNGAVKINWNEVVQTRRRPAGFQRKRTSWPGRLYVHR